MYVTGCDAQTLLEMLQGLLQLSLVFRNVTEDMKCIGLTGLSLQNIPAYGRGLVGLACLVQGDGLLQQWRVHY